MIHPVTPAETMNHRARESKSLIRRSTKLKLSRFASVRDVVADRSNKRSHREIEPLLNTGDMLLYGNPIKAKHIKWYNMARAYQGKGSMERTVPILHTALVVKDPPKDVRKLYGLTGQDYDGVTTFVWEAAPCSPDGPRLLTLKEWLEHELDPAVPDGHTFCRGLKRGSHLIDRNSLWDWIGAAKNIPYFAPTLSAWAREVWIGASMRQGAWSAWITIGSQILMDEVEALIGGSVNPIGRILAAALGMLAQVLMAFGILTLAAMSFFLHWIPDFFETKNNETGNCRPLPIHMICSYCTAETLMRAGILSTSQSMQMYCPKDFLPSSVGAQGSLCDENINEGLKYCETLVEVILDSDDDDENQADAGTCAVSSNAAKTLVTALRSRRQSARGITMMATMQPKALLLRK